MVRLAVGGVLVVVPTVFVAHLVHPARGSAHVVMVRHERQQQYQNYGKRTAECLDGFIHAAKITIRFCKQVAFCIFGHLTARFRAYKNNNSPPAPNL